MTRQHRGRRLGAGVAAALLLLASPTSARHVGFLLQIHDPDRFLDGPTEVKLTPSRGDPRTVTVRDEGGDLDRVAGDRLFCVAVKSFPGGTFQLQLQASGEAWQGPVKVLSSQTKPQVFIKLLPGGKLEQEVRQAGGHVDEPPPSGDEHQARAFGEPIRSPRFPAWLLLALAAALAAPTLLVLRLNRAGRKRAGGAGGEPAGVRLEARSVGAALDGPLAGRQTLVLGGGRTASAAIRTLQARWTPAALVAELERARGEAPALLVEDPSLLDLGQGPCPMEELARRCQGRFDLWMVNGPRRWPRWTGESETGEGG